MEIKLQIDDRWLEAIDRLSKAIESLSNVTVTQWPDLPQPVQQAIDNGQSDDNTAGREIAKPTETEAKPISLDDVRGVCTKAVANGLKETVKAAINEVGAKSISTIKTEHWQQVYTIVSKALEGLTA